MENVGTIIIERPMTDEEKAERVKLAKEAPALEKVIAEQTRREAYQRISDPVYFQWQRGEKTEAEYLDAVAQVKKDYPIPGEETAE